MRPLNSLALAILLVIALPLAVHAEPAGGLSGIMSQEDMAEMGLDKLSPEEQEKLADWIRQNQGQATKPSASAATASAVPAAASTTTAPQASAPATPTTAAPEPATVATAPTQADVDNFGKPAPQADEMRSRIPGTFTGWNGSSQFVLENGQVWQQRYDTKWKTELENPEVVITRHLLGLHRMEVVGTGKSVPVKRIK